MFGLREKGKRRRVGKEEEMDGMERVRGRGSL